MPRPCYPVCGEKRDFMEIKPARSQADFYKAYDPWVGLGTAIVLCLFFITITIKPCVRYTVRQWKMYKFYKNIDQLEQSHSDRRPKIEMV